MWPFRGWYRKVFTGFDHPGWSHWHVPVSGHQPLADATSIICAPTQLTALQQAAVSVARAQPSWDLQPYQRETVFYLAEDAYRQRAATPTK
ncbi:hypothetical protein [Hymenobacter antarcticus]|uniref:Aldehyde dehydrogenase family protein n=1 Tax=Hymenobacter antarcticus TaxID=486270 RepID=A0ABP7QX43_9BACT